MSKRRFGSGFGPLMAVAMAMLLGLLPWQAPRSVSPEGRDWAEKPHHCRFWGCLADTIPAGVINGHLVFLPHSLRNLSHSNPHGWGLAHFTHSDSAPVIRRGDIPAHEDSLFDEAVAEMLDSLPGIGIGHVRSCSSGLCSIPDPHPFHRVKNDREWLFAHNGYIDKGYLLQLLDPDYLAANPPVNGGNEEEWIDSELYFLTVLQTLEEENWDVKRALAFTIRRLRQLIPDGNEALNFVMSDGARIWSYREGRTLYYVHVEGEEGYSAVASMYPEQTLGDWIEVQEGELVTLELGLPPLIENIEDYFYPVGLPGDAESAPGLRLACSPNPFNPATRVSFHLPAAAFLRIGAYDLSGRRVALLVEGSFPEGPHEIRWEGIDPDGRALSSGVYFLVLEAGGRRESIKAVLLK